jgi:methylase of polypeptide subunit release factors
MPTMVHDDLLRLREALARNDFTYDAVAALLGPVAHAALGRADPLPALRATTGGTPLETLVRLFLLGTTEPYALCAGAFHPLPVESGLDLLEPDGDGLRAALDVRPYAADDAHWWVVSDLGTDVRLPPLRPDHVLGVGGASTTLAQATPRHAVAAALDVGTGCGVQALHLSRHAGAVTATDRNPRALRLARWTAALNGLSWELLEGDLLAPVAGRAYDLVVANPPFVAGPGRDDYAYRDSGLAGDALSSRLVAQVPDVLADGGTATLLANWLHVRGADWRERVASWLDERTDALVLQREVQDPAEYVALWLRDAGDTSRQRADEWLDWFAAHEVEGVGFGIVTLRRTGRGRHAVEDAPQPVVQPVAVDIGRWLDVPDDLLDTPLRLAGDVTLEQSATAGAEGWEVAAQALQRHTGLAWRATVDPIAVALVAACDGSRTLRQIVPVLAAAYGVDEDALTAGALPAVRHLSERGFLVPPGVPGR